MTFTNFIKIVEETFALEPADKHTENSILKMLRARFPGDYQILLSADNLRNIKISLVFKNPEDATYFKLVYA